MTQLEDFLKQEAVSSLLQEKGFPVKIQVPIKYTLRAVFKFSKYKFFGGYSLPPKSTFEIPEEYDLISRKEGSKILEQKNKKKRLVLAMAQIRV